MINPEPNFLHVSVNTHNNNGHHHQHMWGLLLVLLLIPNLAYQDIQCILAWWEWYMS